MLTQAYVFWCSCTTSVHTQNTWIDRKKRIFEQQGKWFHQQNYVGLPGSIIDYVAGQPTAHSLRGRSHFSYHYIKPLTRPKQDK